MSFIGFQRFTSIVGPNGSGKSNVIDSLLFVFGKRASKMRLKKVSELIHKSEQHPDLEYCKVTVHFVDVYHDDTDEEQVVPGSDLWVTRTATRNDISKYYVNDRPSKFNEVVDLFIAKGVDLNSGRFLILQVCSWISNAALIAVG